MRIKGADGHEYDVTGQGQGAFNTAGSIAGILALLGVDLGGLLGGRWNPAMSTDALIATLNGAKNASNTGTIEMVLSMIMMLLAQGGGHNFGRGNCGGCSENTPVSRFDLAQSEKMTALESENALLKANIHSDQKLSEVYERLSGRITAVEKAQNEVNMAQAVYNGTNNATLSCMKGQIADLQALTERVVPRRRVCNTGCDCDM